MDPLPASLHDQHGRNDPDVLSTEDCWELLSNQRVGRLAVVVDSWPVVLPVNYALEGRGLVIRAAEGLKLAAARRHANVAFEVDKLDPLYRSGWSVLVLGQASEITEPETLRSSLALSLEPWAKGERPYWILIQPGQITGRRLPRAWRYPGPTG